MFNQNQFVLADYKFDMTLIYVKNFLSHLCSS